MRSFLSLSDVSNAEFLSLLASAASFKRKFRDRATLATLKGRIIGELFEKPSTRTRTSFEVAALRLGGDAVYLSANELQLSRGEPVKDTARILGGYLDAIVARVYAHDTVAKLARYSGIPVVNALSDLEHPTQIVSDFLTILEARRKLSGLKLAYIGDGDNVCNSLLLGATMVGMNIAVACPKGYAPNQRILKWAKSTGRKTGSSVELVQDPRRAASGADVLYTDVWVSMGDEAEKDQRLHDFKGYLINSGLLRIAAKGALVMHCLPAHRGLEITNDVIEGAQSVVWQQGENKLYGAAAVLDFVVNGGG